MSGRIRFGLAVEVSIRPGDYSKFCNLFRTMESRTIGKAGVSGELPGLRRLLFDAEEQDGFDHEIKSVDGVDRSTDYRLRHRFDGDDERDALFGKMRLLLERVDVDGLMGDHLRDPRNDAALIFHGEAEMVNAL